MTNLLSINNHRFAIDKPDVTLYLTSIAFTSAGVNLLDRSGVIVPPFRFTIPEQSQLPSYDPAFSMTYEECCQDRARHILARQDETGSTITVLYSGGIDSSLVLLSFIKEIGLENAEKRVRVAMTAAAIEENPWLWERILRRSNFQILDAEGHHSLYGNGIVVSGEFNDQLFGSDMYRQVIAWRGDSILDTPWTPSLIHEYIATKKLEPDQANFWASLLISVVRAAPCPVDTIADFWWWINFSAKWTSVQWRMLLFAGVDKLSPEWMKNDYLHFYGSARFQRWSMVDRTHKHRGSWLTYKWHAKDLICNEIGPEYGMKTKRGSLWELARVKRKADALAEDGSLLHGVDPNDWYCPENSFTIPGRN